MSKFEKIEDIIAWQKSRTLVYDIYLEFKNCRDFGFRDQIQRASISVMNNIAEGYERKGNKEFMKFLYISKGSCAEVRSMLYVGMDLEYIKKEQFENLYKQTMEISKMLSSLIKALCL
ncbi:MAG: 30S ribosomal protein S23 [uncultured bacterium]|nr:MAG: 30S ribosomal protein S23 [uncultured bacterium]